MKTFLDQIIEGSRVGLLCGHLNDVFISADLVQYDVEQYIHALLRERGFHHIIFYGSDGGRGAFCLDEESAKFFFAPPAAPAMQAASQGSGGGAAADLMRRRAAPAPGQGSSAAPPHQEGQTFSRRNWTLVEFVSAMKNRLLTENDPIALVFYDILNTPLGESPTLINELMGTFQRANNKHLCLLLAPGTDASQENLFNILRASRLADHFTLTDEHGTVLNPLTACRVGLPNEDEMAHLFQRMAMGLGRAKPLRLSEPLDQLAQELVYASRSGFQRGRRHGSLRSIMRLLENDPSDEPLTRDRIDVLMGMDRQDRRSALEKLNRPGWESVHEALSRQDQRLRKEVRDLKEKYPDTSRNAPSLNLRRFSVAESMDDPRPEIPSFLLLGHPGVGKTTISALIGQMLKEAGILRIGHTVMTGQDRLVSSYVGGIPQNVLAAFDEAEEGVLFIDDAQSLTKDDGGVNHAGTPSQIAETMVRAMTDPNRHVCVVLSGYPDEVRQFLKKEAGLARRFSGGGELLIPDYTPPLLKTIFLNRVAEKNYTVDPELTAPGPDGACPLDRFMQKIYMNRSRTAFGNADAMIKLAAEVCGKADSDRVVRKENFFTRDRDESWFASPSAMCSLEAVQAEMNERIVGMDHAKQMLIDKALEIQEMQDLGVPADRLFTRAIVLEGNPGTGKTTLANMLGKLYYGLGLSGTEKPIIHSAGELNSSLAGGNSSQILEWVNQAVDQKAVLVIDEAHQLAASDRVASYRALMAPLTDKERPFQLVLAGYPSPMEKLIAADPGGSRRFVRIPIEDYNADELYRILLIMVKQGGWIIDPQAVPLVQKICRAYEEAHKQDFHIGNGGGMEQLLAAMNTVRRRRVYTQGIRFNEPDANRIIVQDVLNAGAILPALVQQALRGRAV